MEPPGWPAAGGRSMTGCPANPHYVASGPVQAVRSSCRTTVRSSLVLEGPGSPPNGVVDVDVRLRRLGAGKGAGVRPDAVHCPQRWERLAPGGSDAPSWKTVAGASDRGPAVTVRSSRRERWPEICVRTGRARQSSGYIDKRSPSEYEDSVRRWLLREREAAGP